MRIPETEETGGINTSGDVNDPLVLLTRYKAFCELTDDPADISNDYLVKEHDYGNKN